VDFLQRYGAFILLLLVLSPMLGLPLLSIVMYPMAIVIGIWRSGLVWAITYERRASHDRSDAGFREAQRRHSAQRGLPPDPARVRGPLDLLLHLCQTHELAFSTSIAFVAEKYCEYLDMMENMAVEVAAEYWSWPRTWSISSRVSWCRRLSRWRRAMRRNKGSTRARN